MIYGFSATKGVLVTIIYYILIILYISVLSAKPLILIKSFLINLEIILYINFITLLAFPEGIYLTEGGGACWFLGYDNWWYMYFYAAFFFSVLHYKIAGNFFRTLVLLVVLHASALIRKSGVLIFGVIFMDFMIFTGFYRIKIINYINVWVAGIVVNILLLFFSTSGLVTYVIELLQRPINTLLVRINIWNITFREISNNLLLGYARPPAEYRQRLYGLTAGVNAHNMWYELVYEAGIIGIFLFLLIIIAAGRSVSKAKNTEVRQLLLVCLLTCIIGLSVDSVFLELRGILFFALFGLFSEIKRICNKLSYLEEKKKFNIDVLININRQRQKKKSNSFSEI